MNPIIQLFTYLFYEPTYNLLMFFYGITRSFPWAIVLVTLAVRAALIPLFMRQLRSSKAMQEIAPQVQEIQRKYRQEPMVMQKQLQALYKERGVNPYASCLPTLIQLPFLYGLYGAFNEILRAHPKSSTDIAKHIAEMNNQLYPFIKPIFGPSGLIHQIDTAFIFGIKLDSPDPTHILPVIAALATFVQLRMSLSRNKPQPRPAGSAPDPNAATMQMMQYIMPLFTLFIGLSFPAGLALYWTIGTIFTLVQQYFVNGRNWGPLFDGLPGFKPAIAGTAAGIVDAGPGSGTIGRSRTRVVEEKPAPKPTTRPQRTLPSPTANGNGAKPAVKASNANTVNETNAAPVEDAPIAKPATPRPTNTRPTTGAKPAAKKDAVRLVTPQANGNGAGATQPVIAPRATTTRPVTVGPRVTPSNKPKNPAASRPRKKGR